VQTLNTKEKRNGVQGCEGKKEKKKELVMRGKRETGGITYAVRKEEVRGEKRRKKRTELL